MTLQTPVYALRSVTAFIGMLLVWVGCNNAMEQSAAQSMTRDIFYLFISICLLLVTNTVYCMSTVWIIPLCEFDKMPLFEVNNHCVTVTRRFFRRDS